jgi:hypothetical protein
MRIRNWGATAAFAALVAAYFAAYTHAQAQADAKAAAVVADLRNALGGEQKIAAIKSLSLRADYRREMSAGPIAGGGGATFVMMAGPGGPGGGSPQMTGKLEIDLELPDRYLRSDIGSGMLSFTRTEGFDGSRPFVEMVGNNPGMRVMTDNPAADPARAQAALKRSNVELARLLLGVTGGTHPNFPCSFAYAGVAESPDGKAHMLDVTGPEDFKARLYVDTETHLPLMLTYMEAEPRMVVRNMTRDGAGRQGGPRGETRTGSGGDGHVQVQAGRANMPELTPEQRADLDKARKEAEATPPKMVEYRLFYSDYRKVDGVSMPHRIARGVGDKTTEEWDVTSYKVNPTFKADRFKVGR